MRVYLAFNPETPGNPLLNELTDALKRHPEIDAVDTGLDTFWSGPFDYDVVHLQWPEALFRWRTPDRSALESLKDVLQRWRRQSTLIATIHNRRPHLRDNDEFREAYRQIYGAADGIIHMGHASRDAYLEDYGRPVGQLQTIIPHGAYSSFPDEVDRKTAREYLEISADARVAVAFGAIRRIDELELLIRGFDAYQAAPKRLIIAGRIHWPSRRKLMSSGRWLRAFVRLRLDPRIKLYEGFIPDADVQYYLRAADCLLIPRMSALNSGNVALGFSFGTVVAGPNIGVIGEILRETGNPVFNPRVPSSLGDALGRAEVLRKEGKGVENREYAERHWNWDCIVDQHCAFYTRVVSGRRVHLQVEG